MKSPPTAPRRLALVLSGGGARGAYEVGILCNLLPRLAALGIQIDILVATSVGALNACALAATAHFPGVAGARLRAHLLKRIWESIEADRIFNPQFISSILSIPLHLSNIRGPHLKPLMRGSGSIHERVRQACHPRPYHFRALYDTRPLARTLRDGTLIDWRQLRENINGGQPRALALSSTRMRSGETVVFTHSRHFVDPRIINDEHIRLLPTQIDFQHAMASAAIPFLFPPIRLELPGENHKVMFMDGGIRQNTPLLPAVILGADSLLVIGLHSTNRQEEVGESGSETFEVVPTLGKILNAFFLDRVRTDFNRLTIMNRLAQTAAPEALEAINRRRLKKGKDPLREIRAIELTPSKDIGALIAELWRRKPELHRAPWRWIVDTQAENGLAVGDLLSYVFFHPEFTRSLLILGQEDAAREMDDNYLRWLGGLKGGIKPE